MNTFGIRPKRIAEEQLASFRTTSDGVGDVQSRSVDTELLKNEENEWYAISKLEMKELRRDYWSTVVTGEMSAQKEEWEMDSVQEETPVV